MSSASSRNKSVSLTFRGFDESVDLLTSFVGVPTSSHGAKGQPVRENVKTLLVRSYVIFSEEFTNDEELCDMLPRLLLRLGGVEKIIETQKLFNPEFTEINFDIPVSTMDEFSQDGYLAPEVISDVFRLKAVLGFSFF